MLKIRYITPVASCFCLLLTSVFCFAQSIASFPHDYRNWVLVKESVMPGKNVKLPPETPIFLQNTVKTYNWVNDGRGTKLNIFVPPEKLEDYKKHGPYDDGITAVGVYEDSNIVFVTEHFAGEALYGVYNRKGEDISHTHPSLNVKVCVQCHTENKDICINGTCTVPIIDLFTKPKQK